jgi:hypothetical protein
MVQNCKKSGYKLATKIGGRGSCLFISINPIQINPSEKFSANAKWG